MEFAVGACSGAARTGSLQLADGVQVETPGLLLVTQKGLPAIIPPDMLLDLHPDARLCQFTPLHFLESPLSFIVAKAGGIHKLSSLTGFGMVAVARDSLMEFPTTGESESSTTDSASDEPSGPEKYMDLVNACKPDLWVSLPDDVPARGCEKRNRLSVDRSLKWLDQCLSLQNAEYGNRCLGVVVGASSTEERIRSAEQTATRNVPGFSLGGFGMGEDVAQRAALMESVIANLPEEKLRHVCGLGLPEEILQAVGVGLDLFDSTYPFTLTKAGYAMIFPLNMENMENSPSNLEKQPPVEECEPAESGSDSAKINMENAPSNLEKEPNVEESEPAESEPAESGSDSAKINLRSSDYRLDEDQLLTGCKCYTCQRHTRAYIYNLMHTQETLAQTLLAMHNTYHYLEFFKAIREAIKVDKFQEFKNWFTSKRHESRVPSRKTEEL